MVDAHVVDIGTLAKCPSVGGVGHRPVHEQAKRAQFTRRHISQFDACRVVGQPRAT